MCYRAEKIHEKINERSLKFIFTENLLINQWQFVEIFSLKFKIYSIWFLLQFISNISLKVQSSFLSVCNSPICHVSLCCTMFHLSHPSHFTQPWAASTQYLASLSCAVWFQPQRKSGSPTLLQNCLPLPCTLRPPNPPASGGEWPQSGLGVWASPRVIQF